jgi:hypothetical protein
MLPMKVVDADGACFLPFILFPTSHLFTLPGNNDVYTRFRWLNVSGPFGERKRSVSVFFGVSALYHGRLQCEHPSDTTAFKIIMVPQHRCIIMIKGTV